MAIIQKPLLIYDPNCTFCKRWVARWKSITGDNVEYIPSSEPAPETVQFIDVDGSKLIGAAAVFKTLAAGGRGWWSSMYHYIPRFSGVAEACYRFIAYRRRFFSRLTHSLWGDSLMPSTYGVSSAIFLRTLGAIYLIALLSLWSQVAGLYGSSGILPISEYLEAVRNTYGIIRYWLLPSIFWMNSSDTTLRVALGIGSLFSICVIVDRFRFPALLFLWILYLSFVSAGGEFLSYQWDVLLLESGLISLLLLPRHATPRRSILFLLRWLLVRLMMSSGIVKIASGDAAWKSFNALNVHYETQPLPNAFSWYFHQLPDWFHQSSVAGVFFFELIVPLFLFAPRRLRHGASWTIILFQVVIMLTGNYTFFNLLTIALCLLQFDDASWPTWFKKRFALEAVLALLPHRRISPKRLLLKTPLVAFVLFIFILSTIHFARALHRRIEWPSPIAYLARLASPFRSVNSYGLFAIMTLERPEIIIEGSNDQKSWTAYEFKYKPGDVMRTPRFVAPHQPRLDWQMWFASLSTFEREYWFQRFCQKLLEGEEVVLNLMQENPFPDAPPQYLRAELYDYRFTDRATRKETSAWWERKSIRSYSPRLSLPTP